MDNKKQTKTLVLSIIGVLALIVAVSGAAYAYYQASVSNNNTVTGTAGGGAGPELTITKLSTSANGYLIPIDGDKDTLTNAAKGWTGTAVGTSWNSSYACKDKNGYSVCQIYSVTVKNNSQNTETFNITLDSLTGTNTPYIDAVTMASTTSVTVADSIKGKTICTASNVAAGQTSTACHFMVFIKNTNSPQTDNGTFKGTVSATSSHGGQIKATFS